MPVSGGTQFLKPQEVLASLNVIEGMKVADLGCGNLGYFIIPLAKLVGKEGVAYALDIQKSVLDGVKSRAKLEGITNLETVWANLEKAGSIQIPAGSLDIALLINVLFQNKDRKAIIKEAARLLKKGGKLLIIDWKKTGIPFGPAVQLRVDFSEIKKMSAELGLNLIEEKEFGDYFWGLILQKN